MRKKLLLTLCFVLLAVCLLAIAVSAEVYNISYYDGGTLKETVQTDENGMLTLRETRYSDTSAPIFNWFTYEGDVYAPGSTVTFTKDTDVRQFCAYPSTNTLLNHQSSQWGWRYIQLQEDLYLDTTMALNDGGRLYIDLNGYNIYSSAKHVFEQRRSGLFITGSGSIIHTGSGHLFNASIHGYGDGNVGMVIGRDVTVVTAGTISNYTNGFGSSHINGSVPFEFYGTITCSKLMHFNGNISEIVGLVVDPVKLTLTGDSAVTFTGYGDGGSLVLTLGDGTYVLTEAANNTAYWNNGHTDAFTATVNGGSFTNGAEAALSMNSDGKAIVTLTVDGVNYSTIVSASCQHSYAEMGSTAPTCIVLKSTTFTCTACADTVVLQTGDYADHVWVLIMHEPATEIMTGTKIYECTVCYKQNIVIYTFDPNNIYIDVTVLVDGVEKTVSVLVGDVFVMSVGDNMGEKTYTLTGLKDFGEYTASNIVAIEIPVGVAFVNLDSNTTLKKITVNDYANVSFISFAKSTALTDINIGKATVEFRYGCSNNVIAAIRSNVTGANIIFAGRVFEGKSSLKTLELSAYSDYDFGANSFKNSGVLSLVFPDYCRPIFRSEAAFYNCAVTYIYVGKGIKSLEGKPFDYCQKVQKIVLMEVESFTHEYTFCVENGGEKPVEVYIHSETISLPNNTFYQCHGITVYTNAEITNANAFAQCNATTKGGIDYPGYTIVYGIPHKYTEGNSEPTCTADGSTGYVTDCPCGVVTEAVYRTYVGCVTTSDQYNESTISVSVIPALGHDKGALVDTLFENGYLATGVARYDCTRCENNGYYEETLSAVISCLGYSVCEFDQNAAIVQGFSIDEYVLDVCKSANAGFTYGIVVGGNLSGETQYPLTIQNGEIVAQSGVMLLPITADFDCIDIKLLGISDTWKDKNMIICLYIFDGVSIKYADNGVLSSGVTGITYNSFVQQ